MKISGKLLAQHIYENLQSRIEKLKQKDVIPHLVIVKTSDIDAVNAYINQKIKRGSAIGVQVSIVEFKDDKLSRQYIDQQVKELNNDHDIHGIIFQKPSHELINEEAEQLLDIHKDVDGFLSGTLFYPPTYRGMLRVLQAILHKEGELLLSDLRNKNIVVVGKGKTGGKPIIDSLKKDGVPDAALHIIDSKTTPQEKEQWIRSADIVVSAVGKLNPVDVNLFSPKTILIDIGVHFENKMIKGDFHEEDIQNKVAFYTTTPGGIGALTVAFLMANVVEAAERQNNLSI